MVEVIVPWAGTCEHRERALEYTVDRYPWPVTISAINGKWIKANAVNPAVEASTADIIVVADADCVTDGLPAAIEAVADGQAEWAVPHLKVYRLTEAGTYDFIRSGNRFGPYDRPAYRGMMGGGFLVARRTALQDTPLDCRFVGWGQEDESWALALNVLHGKPWRGTADLVHLWHPPAPRQSRRKGSRANWTLHKRYRAARRSPTAMRAILEEIK